jgi:benzoyl-CoA reductase/2-hydroxyglutaryl-CoA dehydratase subunit BcrC/BadD/HgdB
MKPIAYCNPFVPAEWIAAHGLQPRWLRLGVDGGGPLPALARGVCPYVGALIETAQAGLSDASALVLTTVCDQMRYAAALLETRGCGPLFLLNVPSTWQTPAARQLYLDELRRLGQFLVALGGTAPDNAALARVMLDCDHGRNADAIGHSDVGVPLALLGGPLLESDRPLLDLLERCGGRVVLDATEGAERTMPRPFDPVRVASEPLRELADAYFDGIPDAFRRPNTGLYEWLGRQLAARQVRGIIFRRYVWCDLWHAELQRVRQWTRLPVLELDVGPDDTGAPNRIQGRIEAFLETFL